MFPNCYGLKSELLTDENDLDPVREVGAPRDDDAAADAVRPVAIPATTCHGARCIAV